MEHSDSIAEARAFLQANIDRGSKCPCCGQNVQLFPRSLSSEMARFLIALHRAPKGADGWVDIKNVEVRGGDYAKSRYWGLVENAENDDPSKGSSGLWRLTQKGLDFINDRIRVPKKVYVYNRKVRRVVDEDVGIRQALGKKFDYQELMIGKVPDFRA